MFSRDIFNLRLEGNHLREVRPGEGFLIRFVTEQTSGNVGVVDGHVGADVSVPNSSAHKV